MLAAVVGAAFLLGCGSNPADPAEDPNSNVNVSREKPVIGGPAGDEGTATK